MNAISRCTSPSFALFAIRHPAFHVDCSSVIHQIYYEVKLVSLPPTEWIVYCSPAEATDPLSFVLAENFFPFGVS